MSAMSVCPGCGRCRQCGQPTPVARPHPWWQYPAQPYMAPAQPIWITPYWSITGGMVTVTNQVSL